MKSDLVAYGQQISAYGKISINIRYTKEEDISYENKEIENPETKVFDSCKILFGEGGGTKGTKRKVLCANFISKIF